MPVESFERIAQRMLAAISTDEQPAGIGLAYPCMDPGAVPEDERERVLKDLAAEVRARCLMGDKAYFDSLTVEDKAACYERALAQILESYGKLGALEERMTWAQFRRLVATYVSTLGNASPVTDAMGDAFSPSEPASPAHLPRQREARGRGGEGAENGKAGQGQWK